MKSKKKFLENKNFNIMGSMSSKYKFKNIKYLHGTQVLNLISFVTINLI